MRDLTNIAVNGDRLWQSLMEMAKIGATEKGGNCRLALTDLDKQGRDLFVEWCREAGLQITVDAMGSIFARRAGRDPQLAPVVLGSHLDTQPTGGRFDGVFGVLAGLEVVRSLNDLDIETEHPIEVAVWTNEEGSRFAPAMVASGVFAGVFALDYAHARQDREGKSLGAELQRIGYAGDQVPGEHPVAAYFEAHIEQGPILEEEGIEIGVVTGAQGQSWYDLIFEGQESHAGPTPMARRRDALLGAARCIELVNRIGHDFAPHACATVGTIENHPNSRNVVPGRCSLTIDLRHPDDGLRAEMDDVLRNGIAKIAQAGGLTYALERISEFQAVPFDEGCVADVRVSAEKLGYSTREIVSGAGHDACYLAKVAPSAMIFIPCIDGISHNEIEDAKPEWITAGANVLFHAALSRAGRAGGLTRTRNDQP